MEENMKEKIITGVVAALVITAITTLVSRFQPEWIIRLLGGVTHKDYVALSEKVNKQDKIITDFKKNIQSEKIDIINSGGVVLGSLQSDTYGAKLYFNNLQNKEVIKLRSDSAHNGILELISATDRKYTISPFGPLDR